jgi:hypothetical protein
VLGTAVPRSTAPSRGTLIVPLYGYPWYGFSPYYGALGLGPGAYSFSSEFGYGYPFAAPSSFAYASDLFDIEGPTGGLRLKVEPKQAQVFVDGYYAGIVDDFNGRFQHLDVAPGPHHVEVRSSGYEPLEFDITIQPRHTIEYRGALVPLPPS